MINYLRAAAGIGLSTTIKHLRSSSSGAAGNGLGTTIKYLRGAAGIGLGTSIKYLRCTTSAAAGSGLGTKINEHSTTMHNERRRGHLPGHHNHVPYRRGGVDRPAPAAQNLGVGLHLPVRDLARR
jgi:hypothetical protein